MYKIHLKDSTSLELLKSYHSDHIPQMGHVLEIEGVKYARTLDDVIVDADNDGIVQIFVESGVHNLTTLYDKLDAIIAASGGGGGNASAANQATQITNQGTINTSLATIDTTLSSQATAAHQVTQNTKLDTLETGKATAAHQVTQNTKLDTLETGKATAAHQVTQITKLDTLETGKATAAHQVTQNTKLDTLETGKATAAHQVTQNTKLDTLELDKATATHQETIATHLSTLNDALDGAGTGTDEMRINLIDAGDLAHPTEANVNVTGVESLAFGDLATDIGTAIGLLASGKIIYNINVTAVVDGEGNVLPYALIIHD